MALTDFPRRGLMIVLSSPSGAGKTVISKELMKLEPLLSLSISATTREPRTGEENGVHYYFVSTDEFNSMKKNGELLEHAAVFGNFYGTPKKAVEKALSSGKDVLFDIDWQGTQQLAQKASQDLCRIFILPPSMEELGKRLVTRAQDSEEIIRNRMSKAADEMSHWPEYDYIIVNHDIEKSVHQIQSILIAERLKRERQTGLVSFVNNMRDEIEK
ncbi:MAG: guanylate kinase [Alphaproteobacteria bacterium]|nr:guanylate kinase [Alphaproteobacteria bacterium]